MYLTHFNLKREPFHITPDPYFLYLSTSHKEAFGSMIYGFRNKKGFVAVIGEVGLGKTTVLRSFLEQYGQKNKIKTVFVFNANVSFKGLLKIIYGELGYTLPDKSFSGQKMEALFESVDDLGEQSDEIFELVQDLHTLLIKEFQQGTNVILVIDEAQNMPVRTLENLRMLSNLETATDKLLQIFLIGQPELEKKLNRKELRQLRQRIAIRAILKPLTPQESQGYIRHRLRKAGAEQEDIFTRRALKRIVRLSQGIPRKINILCDNALITGFGYGKTVIGPKIIKEVNDDLEGRSFHSRPRKTLLVLVLFLVLAGGALLVTTTPSVKDAVFSWLRGQGAVNREGDNSAEGIVRDQRAETPQPGLEQGPGQGQTSPEGQKSRPDQDGSSDSSESVTDQPLSAGMPQDGDRAAAPDDASSRGAGASLAQNGTASMSAALQASDGRNGGGPVKTGPQQSASPSSALSPQNSSMAEAQVSTSPGTAKPDYEALYLESELAEMLPVFSQLSRVRQQVLIELARQISVNGVMTFKRMLAALNERDFDEATRQMVHSRWADRVGDRAFDLAQIMRSNDADDLKSWLAEKE